MFFLMRSLRGLVICAYYAFSVHKAVINMTGLEKTLDFVSVLG